MLQACAAKVPAEKCLGTETKSRLNFLVLNINTLSANNRLVNNGWNELNYVFIFLKNDSGMFLWDDFLDSSMLLLQEKALPC